MGVMPVNKLLINMSVPMIVSMLVQAFYNVVDSYYVAKLSENALTAVSLAFPVQNLLIAAGVGIGVGMNALISKALGEKDGKKAGQTAAHGLMLSYIAAVLFFVLGLFGTTAFMNSQTDVPEIVEMGSDYLKICCCLSFGVFTQISFERMLLSTGKTKLSMIAQSVGAITNIILDPVFIFGKYGAPAMGVEGAAVATVIGQTVAGITAIILHFTLNKELKIKISYFFKTHISIFGRIMYIGTPSILLAAIGSVMTYCMNLLLIAYTSTAVAVFGVYFKLQSFAFMPVFGLNNGMVPIIAYNYGARKFDRIHKTLKLSIIYAVSIMLIALLVFQIFPDRLLSIFNASAEMKEIGRVALRTISLSYLFAGFCIVAGSVCQALGKSMYSLFVSIGRQLVVLIPAAFLLSRLGNVNYIWLAFPIAETMSLILSAYFLKTALKKIKAE